MENQPNNDDFTNLGQNPDASMSPNLPEEKIRKGPLDLIIKAAGLDVIYFAITLIGTVPVFIMAWASTAPGMHIMEYVITALLVLVMVFPIVTTILYVISIAQFLARKMPIPLSVITLCLLHLLGCGAMSLSILNMLSVEYIANINPLFVLLIVIFCIVMMSKQIKNLTQL